MALSQSNVIEKMVFPTSFVTSRSEAMRQSHKNKIVKKKIVIASGARQSKPIIPNNIAMPHLVARKIIRRIRCIQKI